METDFFLIGNSHNVALKKYAESQLIKFHGGTLGPDPITNDSFFNIKDGKFLLIQTPRIIKPKLYESLLDFKGVVLTTIGFNSMHFVRGFKSFLSENNLIESEISDALFGRLVLDSRFGALEFYRILNDYKIPTYFTCSTQDGYNSSQIILNRFETILIRKIQDLGGIFIETRDELLNDDGCANPEYQHQDKMHGNSNWAALVIDRFNNLLDSIV